MLDHSSPKHQGANRHTGRELTGLPCSQPWAIFWITKAKRGTSEGIQEIVRETRKASQNCVRKNWLSNKCWHDWLLQDVLLRKTLCGTEITKSRVICFGKSLHKIGSQTKSRTNRFRFFCWLALIWQLREDWRNYAVCQTQRILCESRNFGKNQQVTKFGKPWHLLECEEGSNERTWVAKNCWLSLRKWLGQKRRN